MRTHMRIILSFGALALLAAPAHADRGRNPLAGQPAIRHRLEMRKMRLEITPQFMISANQPFLIGFGGGANIRFHLLEDGTRLPAADLLISKDECLVTGLPESAAAGGAFVRDVDA